MILFLMIGIAALVGQLFLPWWIIIPVSLIACYLKANSGWSAFSIAFSSIFLLWFLTASYLSFQNEHLLANRIGQMFGLPQLAGNWAIMTLISALPGAITAGFAGLTGFYLRKIITNN